MTAFGRRSFLRHAGTAAASTLISGGALPKTASAYAPRKLVPDPQRFLDLPQDFSYRVISQRGAPMSDGYRVPGRPDAMGVFAGAPDTLVLMRNHEIMQDGADMGPLMVGQTPPPESYDAEAHGGVTRLVLDARTLAVKHENLVLTGTYWNCAGGLSPWGWLTCEEIFVPEHGYVFLCATDAQRVATPVRIPSYGRFRHEAATVDPNTLIAYLTEDMDDAAFYRFVPHDRSAPFEGKLQALAIVDADRFDTSMMQVGERLPVRWVDVPEPNPTEDNVRLQAREHGAARFKRTEGLWLAGNSAYITATTGGPIGRGQIFRLDHTPEAAASLELIVQSTDTAELDMPDNLTFSPHGQLYVAEDGFDSNHLRRVTPDGRIIDFARCVGSASEFAGVCFAPDGNTLFVNLQHDGLTLAITGPFEREARVIPATRATSVDARGADGCHGVAGIGGGLTVLALAALAERKRRLSEPKPTQAERSD